MKHILLTISLILGATGVSAETKVWAFNITDIRLPMKVADYIINTPTSGGYFFIVYKDDKLCVEGLENLDLSTLHEDDYLDDISL